MINKQQLQKRKQTISKTFLAFFTNFKLVGCKRASCFPPHQDSAPCSVDRLRFPRCSSVDCSSRASATPGSPRISWDYFGRNPPWRRLSEARTGDWWREEPSRREKQGPDWSRPLHAWLSSPRSFRSRDSEAGWPLTREAFWRGANRRVVRGSFASSSGSGSWSRVGCWGTGGSSRGWRENWKCALIGWLKAGRMSRSASGWILIGSRKLCWFWIITVCVFRIFVLKLNFEKNRYCNC